jgi:tRNA-2-methylthio-N6-dimethylallyladenosine synthase
VVETNETAKLILDQYSTATSSPDPFGDLAYTISACLESRTEGGTLGWMDLNKTNQHQQWHPLLPLSIFQQLIPLAPKVGDVHILTASETNQVHLVKVEELLLQPSPRYNDNNNNQLLKVGSHVGMNALLPRSSQKLKGKGAVAKSHSNPKTYFIQTNGCQMNVADSERLQGILETDLGLRPVGMSTPTNDETTTTTKPAKPDIVIINTCSIRDHAEQKLYDILGPHRARKRQGEALTLIVTGCVAQQEGQALLRKIPELDVVLGPQYVPFLSNILEQLQWNGSHQMVVTAPMLHQEGTVTAAAIITRGTSGGSVLTNDQNYDDDTTSVVNGGLLVKPIRGHPIKAFVNTILGCNEHCTYCVVPATRGMEQSRSMEAVLHEILELIPQGYKEITLLGQNIDAYGRDMVPKRSFAQLLEYLDTNIPTDKVRIRYTTSHPRYMSDRAIDAIAHLSKVCEGYHVPFQAGDNEVLKRMRRGYTYESYLKIIERIRRESPDAGIFADVIVGFPGETEEQFQRTLDLMNEVKFDNLNAFAYSKRPNTEAALWEENETEGVSEDVKKKRLLQVQELAARHGLERSQRYVGRIVDILVEDANPKDPKHQVMGRTRQGRQVYFNGNIETLRGEFVQVEITEARTWSLLGRMVALS